MKVSGMSEAQRNEAPLDRRVRHLVMFSGGVGSWATAKRVVERHGTENTVLLFADTNMEDEDLYRFLGEAAENIGAPLVRVADGRNVWELFYGNHCIGNGKVDLCSSKLKRELLDKWRNEHCDPEQTTIYIGIDWTEEHRLRRAQECGAPWRYAAPMCEAPYMQKKEMLEWLKREGIEPPRLYKMGFPHNNCGGFCVKAGHAQFELLLRTMPERFRWHEQWEERVRADQIARGIVPSSVLYHRRGGPRQRITLREFREQIERQPELLDEFDWGGCGCALGA
jgi:3'-phosphoadenosine 5'-phosphosulfate sulfotransferase (PAPS reductase)/FAD synthetase